MSITKIKTDVIIVGAGPAGMSTSFFLTKAKIPHIIIEKEVFPRDKVCGDGCTVKTVQVLKKANPLWLQEFFDQKEYCLPSYGVKVVAPNGKQFAIPFMPDGLAGQQAPAFISPRLALDNFLFQKLTSPYLTLFQNSSIKQIENDKAGKITIGFTAGQEQVNVTAPLVVAADGDKSQVRKIFLKEPALSKAYAVGLRSYYKGVSGLQEDNFMELHFLKETLPGYFWIFPLPNGLTNVGIGMPSASIRKHKLNLKQLLANILANHPDIRQRFVKASLTEPVQGWGIPMNLKRRPVSTDQCLLVGDAASLVDPFSGEGIGNALFSGMLAAEAIEKSLLLKNHSAAFFKKNYDDVLFKELGNELKVSGLLHRFCRYPSILNFIANKVQKKPSRIKTISAMFTNMNLRYELKKPSFYLKLLFR